MGGNISDEMDSKLMSQQKNRGVGKHMVDEDSGIFSKKLLQ
jgi:hypothetical protein